MRRGISGDGWNKIGYLYCYTSWSTMCIDLNKTPKK